MPFPSSIGLYQPGQGYPKFDQKKADEYFRKVNDKVFLLISDTIAKWDAAGAAATAAAFRNMPSGCQSGGYARRPPKPAA